jgi:hypothetical protein
MNHGPQGHPIGAAMEQSKSNPQPQTSQPRSVASSAQPSSSSMGLVIDGTDVGALNKEYFFVEGQTKDFRRVLPHGHATYDMYGQLANISYTCRNGTKIPQVTDWNVVQADSAPIYNAMYAFFNG